MTKYLDQVRLKVERHPHFAFFRNGKHIVSCTYLNIAHAQACCYQSPPACNSHPKIFVGHLKCAVLTSVLDSTGSQQFWFTGANQEKFESYIQQHVTPKENPAAGLSMFAMRAHRAKVGLTRS